MAAVPSYRGDKPPPLPSAQRVQDWLRANITRSPRSRWLRWLGEPTPFRYEISGVEPMDFDFFVEHRVFSVSGERELLPFSALPSGSWGLFSIGPEGIERLGPRDGSLTRLLRAEGRPLHEGDSLGLVRLICRLELSENVSDHTIVRGEDHLRHFGPASEPWLGYEVDEAQLRRARARLRPLSIEPLADEGGWSVQFTSVYGWMHEKEELGLESLLVSPDYVITRQERIVISQRIFSKTPSFMY